MSEEIKNEAVETNGVEEKKSLSKKAKLPQHIKDELETLREETKLQRQCLKSNTATVKALKAKLRSCRKIIEKLMGLLAKTGSVDMDKLMEELSEDINELDKTD